MSPVVMLCATAKTMALPVVVLAISTQLSVIETLQARASNVPSNTTPAGGSLCFAWIVIVPPAVSCEPAPTAAEMLGVAVAFEMNLPTAMAPPPVLSLVESASVVSIASTSMLLLALMILPLEPI